MIVVIKNETLTLLPEKAIYWERKKVLLLSDLHLGKSGHFRKSGIPLPSQIHYDDLKRISKIIFDFRVEKIYLLGDLFHSAHNNEWNDFICWRKTIPQIDVHLVKGNHDILSENDFLNAEIILHDFLIEEPFIFYHEQNKTIENILYQISGHIHPGVRLNGKGKQSAAFPCFYFGKRNALLPAFGNFTGHVSILPNENDQVFIILNDKIIAYS
jgi:uncharacterized protein